MLIELKLLKEKIKPWNDNLLGCIKEYGDPHGYFKSWIIEDNKCRLMHPLEEHPIGFYSMGMINNIEDLTAHKLESDYYSFTPKTLEECRGYNNPRDNYGVCDNYKQILKEYPELENDKDRLFIVSMTLMTKEYNSDWRWHKWGKYLGDYVPQYEHLGDEDIESVICFHIYEMKP